MSHREEGRIVLRARTGDRTAFGHLYKVHFPGIHATVSRRKRNRDEVDDLVQVTFVRAFLGLKAFRGDSAFSTWLTRIALNMCNSHYRASRERRQWIEQFSHTVADELHSTAGENPEESMHRKQRREIVMRHIRALPANYRGAMWLRYVEDFSYTEIETKLQVPMGTVKTWLWRGRQLLKEAFQETGSHIL